MQIHTIKERTNKKQKTKIRKSDDAIKRIDKPDLGNRKKSSATWIRRHLSDEFVRKSKVDGYICRAAYKIIEIDDKYKILKSGINILDLGAAPGSWMQVIWDKVKSKNSLLMGIDLLPNQYKMSIARSKWEKNVGFIEGDFNDDLNRQEILSFFNNKIDLIVSDISPNVTGKKNLDHLLIMNIANEIADFSEKNLSKKGALVLKIFQGIEQQDFVAKLKRQFNKVDFAKPKSSRKNSSEVYLVCLDKKSSNKSY